MWVNLERSLSQTIPRLLEFAGDARAKTASRPRWSAVASSLDTQAGKTTQLFMVQLFMVQLLMVQLLNLLHTLSQFEIWSSNLIHPKNLVQSGDSRFWSTEFELNWTEFEPNLIESDRIW